MWKGYSTLSFVPVILIPEVWEGEFYTVLLTFPELLIPEAREREVVFVLVQIDLHCWIKVRFHFLKAISYSRTNYFLTPPFCERHEKAGKTGFEEHASHRSAWRGICIYICTVDRKQSKNLSVLKVTWSRNLRLQPAYLFIHGIRIRVSVCSSVADPDSYVFGPPGSGSV